LSVALEQRANLTKIALKLTKYLYRTYLSPSTWSTPCAPDSKHNNALYLPPALILPLRCRHGAGLRTERGGLQTKKKFFSCLGAAYGVCALRLRADVGVGVGLGVGVGVGVGGLSLFSRPTSSESFHFFRPRNDFSRRKKRIFLSPKLRCRTVEKLPSGLRTHERRLGAVVGTKKSSGRAMFNMNKEGHVHLVNQFYSK
jgi:hypothetical protein